MFYGWCSWHILMSFFLTTSGLLQMLENLTVEANKVYISQLKRLKREWCAASFCLLFKSTVLGKGILSQLDHILINFFQDWLSGKSEWMQRAMEKCLERPCFVTILHELLVPGCPWDLWEWSYQPGTK